VRARALGGEVRLPADAEARLGLSVFRRGFDVDLRRPDAECGPVLAGRLRGGQGLRRRPRGPARPQPPAAALLPPRGHPAIPGPSPGEPLPSARRDGARPRLRHGQASWWRRGCSACAPLGCDAQPRMAAGARRNLAHFGLGGDVLLADAQRLPLRDGAWRSGHRPALWSLLPARRRGPRRAVPRRLCRGRRVLAPGGRAVLCADSDVGGAGPRGRDGGGGGPTATGCTAASPATSRCCRVPGEHGKKPRRFTDGASPRPASPTLMMPGGQFRPCFAWCWPLTCSAAPWCTPCGGAGSATSLSAAPSRSSPPPARRPRRALPAARGLRRRPGPHHRHRRQPRAGARGRRPLPGNARLGHPLQPATWRRWPAWTWWRCWGRRPAPTARCGRRRSSGECSASIDVKDGAVLAPDGEGVGVLEWALRLDALASARRAVARPAPRGRGGRPQPASRRNRGVRHRVTRCWWEAACGALKIWRLLEAVGAAGAWWPRPRTAAPYPRSGWQGRRRNEQRYS